MFETSSPKKTVSLIFTFLVYKGENFQLSQPEALCFFFLKSSQVI